MRFYTGDIAEILNLSKKQIKDIRSQNCNFSLQPNRDIAGMKYKLRVCHYGGSNYDGQYIRAIGWNHGGHVAEVFKPEQLRLYKRPLKNWIKYFLRFA